ncbi:hypothetical protein [Rickettsia endosymbiont of Orchestes rusci]|uniref:hypothetical protein n=1 Tax=Rickettsia endosymbiont of Orchestes rusci TaxID=3066250 RepID=UPI00313C34F2
MFLLNRTVYISYKQAFAHVQICRFAVLIINHFFYTILWQIVSGIGLFTGMIYIFIFVSKCVILGKKCRLFQHDASGNPYSVGTNLVGGYFAAFLYTAYGQLFQEQVIS